jgi:hypothetical protein
LKERTKELLFMSRTVATIRNTNKVFLLLFLQEKKPCLP